MVGRAYAMPMHVAGGLCVARGPQKRHPPSSAHTPRALRVLREAALIAAEDTRTTRKLLAHHGIRARLTSYHEHNKDRKIPYILSALEQNDVSLVSEAGMP